MIRANTRAVVSMEILVEKYQVAPERIALKIFHRARKRPPAVLSADKDMPEPFRDLTRHLPQIRVPVRTCRAWHLEIFPIIVVKFLQRFDQQIIDRHPDRPTPIRISTEHPRG